MADTNPPSGQDASTFDPSQLSDSLSKTLEAEMDMGIEDGQPPKDPTVEHSPELRIPTQKDISLREFMSKMDDYAPIIPDAVTEHYLALAGLPPSSTPIQLSRLLALATQKFIADIAADAYQYSRMRSSNSGAGPSTAAAAAGAATGLPGASQQSQQPQQREDKGKSGAHVLGVQRPGYGGGGGGAGQGGAVLTMEDLGCAVGEYGVNVKRGEFYHRTLFWQMLDEKMSSHLIRLPFELKYIIIGHINQPTDLKALCLVSKDISEIAIIRLYRDLYFPFMTFKDKEIYTSLLDNRGLQFVQSIRFGPNDHHSFFEYFLNRLLAKVPKDCLKTLDTYLTPTQLANTFGKHQKRLHQLRIWFPLNTQDEDYQEILNPDILQQLKSITELHMCMDGKAIRKNALARQLLTMMGESLHTLSLQSASSSTSILSQSNFGITHLILEDVNIFSLQLQNFAALTHLSLAYCRGQVKALHRYAKPTLQHLCLLDSLPRSNFKMIVEFLLKFNGLKSLAVCHTWHLPGPMNYLKEGLSMHRKTLEFLNLDVRSEIGAEIYEALKKCTKLKQLGLNAPVTMGYALGACYYKDITNYFPNLVTLRLGYEYWQFNALSYYNHVKTFANGSRSPFHLPSASNLKLLCFGQASHGKNYHAYLDVCYGRTEVTAESAKFAATRKAEDNCHVCFYRRGKNDIVEILPRLAKYYVEESSLVDFGFQFIKTPWGRETFCGGLRR